MNKNKRVSLSRDSDSLSLSEKLVDHAYKEKKKSARGTKKKKINSFPKSTLAKHRATVTAPLRLFGQFRLEHEIVPLHFFFSIRVRVCV